MCTMPFKAFDGVHFINVLDLTKVDITEFQKVIVAGFVHTLPFYRQIMPEWTISVLSGSAVPWHSRGRGGGGGVVDGS